MKFIQLIKQTFLSLMVLQLTVQTSHAGALQITVTSSSDESQTGLITLREAVEEANTTSGAEIVFDPAIFEIPQTIELTQGEISIITNVTIVGPGADLLTIDAANQSRIFNLDDSDNNTAKRTDLSGITLTNGNAEGIGGCINSREKLILRDAVIKNCQTTGRGGGVSTLRDGNVIENTTFINNSAGTGGGLGHQAGNGLNLVIGSTFVGNFASSKGGGLFIFQTSGFEVVNSTFSDNTSTNGAGMFMASAAKIVNSTIVNNTGTGVFLKQNNIQNSIIALNTGGDCELDQTGFDNFNNLDSDGSCDLDAVNHITVIDPRLGPLSNNGGLTRTHAPLFGSPVIDSGDDFSCTGFDQRGVSRPRDGDADGTPTCDIGAVEFDFELDEVIFSNGFEDPLG